MQYYRVYIIANQSHKFVWFTGWDTKALAKVVADLELKNIQYQIEV